MSVRIHRHGTTSDERRCHRGSPRRPGLVLSTCSARRTLIKLDAQRFRKPIGAKGATGRHMLGVINPKGTEIWGNWTARWP
jgi:hypothetical protein